MESRNEYPIYIVSKGRWENPLTAESFNSYGIKYYIVVEPQESESYIEKLGKEVVIILPFSNLSLGSFPARNYCWEHAKSLGFKYHWVFDDNIRGFDKWINSKRVKMNEGIPAINYVEKHITKHNIDIGGFEYDGFVRSVPKKPFKYNCHVYSAMLIKTDLPYRWRLKYNEDVDLCLQVLHNGGTTASCIYYMINKTSTTAKMKGGNQDELYKGNSPEKKLLKAKMLEAVWGKYVKTVIRFNRYHHLVDWRAFKNNSKNYG